jgi:molybdenum cofactor cytidylyltransferase
VNVAGLILAGGASLRMGTAKALLKVNGETFLDRLIGVFATHCESVNVVLGYQAEEIRAGISRSGEANFFINRTPELGQFSSLQTGLRSLPRSAQAVIFTPVDYPNIAAETVGKLIHALDALESAAIAVPRHNGRRGHPVIFRTRLIPEFLSLPADAEARQIIHAYKAQTLYVDVNDAGILRDVDNPAAYAELLSAASE